MAKKDVKELLKNIKEKKEEVKEEELVAPEPPVDDKTTNQLELLHNDGMFRLQLIYELQQINKHLGILSSFVDEE